MSVLNVDIKGDRTDIKFGRVYLDKELILRDYDTDAKEFLGVYNNGNFMNLAYDEDSKKDFDIFFEKLRQEQSARMVTVIKNLNDMPRLVDVVGVHNEREDSCYEIFFTDISNVEKERDMLYDNVWKYRIMMGFSGCTFFDYNYESDVISFYKYVTRKSIRLYYGKLEDFKRDVVTYEEADDKNIAEIQTLLGEIENKKNTIEAKFNSAFLHKDKKMQHLRLKARYDNANGHSMLYGSVVASNDTSDDIPYYMTDAGLDPMTGLLNKRAIVEYTEDIITNKANSDRAHYMILLDIDDFKHINDNYGHMTGDKAIQLLAKVLADDIKDAGIIGRFGGDEFYIFTDIPVDEDVIRRILRTVRVDVERKAKEELGIEKMTLSMGVSLYPDFGRSYTELFALADKCLYIAKEKGKDRYIIYRPDLHQNIQTGAERKGISSYDEQSKAMNQAVRDLFLDGREAIGDSLNLIVKGFDLDNIDIFYGKELRSVYNCGKYASNLSSKEFIENGKYMRLFDSSGLYIMNNYSNHQKTLPEIYEILQKHNCMSLIQMALPSPDMPEFFISFNMLNRTHKWSEAEINNLSLFGTLIYQCMRTKRERL